MRIPRTLPEGILGDTATSGKQRKRIGRVRNLLAGICRHPGGKITQSSLSFFLRVHGHKNAPTFPQSYSIASAG